MARPLLNKKLFALYLILNFGLAQAEDGCREVNVISKLVDVSEKVDLCFLKDTSYFISRNCKNLDCKFIQNLRVLQITSSTKERPGARTCKALGGGVETVNLEGFQDSVQRCIFKEEHSSISLNLLESWDGKTFTGPGPSVDF